LNEEVGVKAIFKTLVFLSLFVTLGFCIPLFFPFAMASNSGASIDLFCQHGGVGENVPAYPPFFVGQLINLFAYVTYNQAPVRSVLVAFQVDNPQGFPILETTSQTNASGYATTNFTITQSLYSFFPSSWEAIATTSPAQHSVNDTMQFIVIERLTVTISPTFTLCSIGESILFTSLVNGGIAPYYYQWYLNGTAVTGANGPTWTFTPASPGTYYIYLKVTDSMGNIALSNVAKVEVITTRAVGGRSMPANVSNFFALWLSTTSLLTAALVLKVIIVRKRRN
jgi:hypothetical protein